MFKRKVLILSEGLTQGLDGTTLTAEKKYSINFTVSSRKLCLSFHFNETNSYLFVNGKEIIKFKAKDSEIVVAQLCLRNISEDFSAEIKRQDYLYMSMILVLIMMLF